MSDFSYTQAMHSENARTYFYDKKISCASVWQNTMLQVCQSYTNCYLEIITELREGNGMISLQVEAYKGEKS